MVHGVTYKEDNFDNTEQLKGICILIKQQAVHGGGGGDQLHIILTIWMINMIEEKIDSYVTALVHYFLKII